MTDLELFKSLLDKLQDESYEESDEPLMDGGHSNTSIVVRVLHGYRAHFEAEFDENGNILSIGQWEEM